MTDQNVSGMIDWVVAQRIGDAFVKHHDRYNDEVYSMATEGKTLARCDALNCNALALCGHPAFAWRPLDWDAAELKFLSLFIDCEHLKEME